MYRVAGLTVLWCSQSLSLVGWYNK